MKLILNVWRQDHAAAPGRFVSYAQAGLVPEMSLLEALDRLNEQLCVRGERPIAFDSDCREGICGACGFLIDGRPHGPLPRTTTCELRLRAFADGACVTLEPLRAAAFPLLRDLMVDRSALDRVIQAGGFVSVRTGTAPEANATPIAKPDAERALDAASCIGCGACVAACPNASAALFTSAKLTHLALLPQGRIERTRRAASLVAAADREGFGACSLHGECQAACPKAIDIRVIARANREFLRGAAGVQALPRPTSL
jgi:succinate dehydrogenase / fumarate reductase iron-sulfur subunit